MRVFIAIDIPKNIKLKLRKIQDLLPEFFGKKTELENLHLTLKFLGEVDEEKVKKIKERLSEIKSNQFEVFIDSAGVFSEKFIRIVWLHLRGAESFQKIIDDNLGDLFNREKRFMSHLTIARVKSCNKGGFLEGLANIKIPEIKFRIDNFRLKKSVLTSEGPVYEDIAVYKLKI